MIQRNDKRTALLLLFIVAFSIVGYRVGFAVGSDAINNAVYQAGTQISDSAYTVFRVGSTYYAKNGVTGAIDYTSSNASYIYNTVVALVSLTGGTIHVKPAVYELSQKIYFPSSAKGSLTKSVGFKGEDLSGLPIYLMDIGAVPFGSTVFRPTSTYTGPLIQLGDPTDSNYTGVSVAIENIALNGYAQGHSGQGSSYITMTNTSAAILGYNVENSLFQNIAIMNCYYGMYFTTGPSATSDFVTIQRVGYAYNYHHLRIDGQAYAYTVTNCYGYLSYATGWILSTNSGYFSNIQSNADDYEIVDVPESTFHITGQGINSYKDITIQNSKDAAMAGVRGIYMDFGSQCIMTFDTITIQGVNGDGVKLAGNKINTRVYFTHLYSSPSDEQYWGGDGRLSAVGLHNLANDTMLVVTDSILKGNYANYTGLTANITMTNVEGYP